MPQGGPPSQLPVANSAIVWIRGVLDGYDPVDSDGNPKWDDGATVAWEIRSAAMNTDGTPGGIQVASGSAVSKGSGLYACLLGAAITILFGEGYYFRVTITLTGATASAVIERPFSAYSRTGETPVT